MKIALVSKTNGCRGGASFFAENLAAWLVESGHETVHFCVETTHPIRQFQRKVGSKGLMNSMVRHFNWRARCLGAVEPFPREYCFELKRVACDFDLFHFHDLYKAISPRTVTAVARHRPTMLTLHDCSAFTGGCLYPFECNRFSSACGLCPRRAEIGRLDFTKWNLKQMRKVARSRAVHYIFPSKWIQEQSSRSLHIEGSATCIGNGFGPEPYNFTDQQTARRVLGLPSDAKIVAVSSSALDDKRKGFTFALSALEANRDLNVFVLLIGNSSPQIEGALLGFKILAAGFIEERARLGLFYSAADLLLFPSLADNLPITIQEAMAAGTPVVAFRVGGIPELVENGKTGWLVPLGDQKALNEALRRALLSDNTKEFGERARSFVAEQFSRQRCVERHLELYKSVIERWRAEAARS